jgi:hypothetical protein
MGMGLQRALASQQQAITDAEAELVRARDAEARDGVARARQRKHELDTALFLDGRCAALISTAAPCGTAVPCPYTATELQQPGCTAAQQ